MLSANRLIGLVRKHSALGLMVCSAGVLFLGTYLAKALLDDSQFIEWSYILTFITVLTSFGLFGSENLLIRFGRLNSTGRMELPTNVVTILAVVLPCSALVVFPFVFTWMFRGAALQYWQLASLTLLIALALIFGNCLRISKRFDAAQFVMNGWRFFAPLVILLVASQLATVANAVILVLALLFIGCALLGRDFFSSLVMVGRAPEVGKVCTGFIFSLAVVTAISNFDRLIVEKTLGSEAFAEYVYLLMYFVFPINLLASYLGFREAVEFQAQFSVEIFVRKTVMAVALAAALFAVTAVAVIVFRDVLMVSVSPNTVVAFFLLAVTRCAYSIASAAMAARGSAVQIYAANGLSFVVLLIATGGMFLGGRISALRLSDILYVVALVWFLRWVAYVAVSWRQLVTVSNAGLRA